MEGSRWVAQALNVEVSSFGDTLDEAKAAIREALELYFEGDGPQVVSEIDSVTFDSVDVRIA